MTILQKLLIDGAYVKPAHILESLTAEQAAARPEGVPHTLYEELWHLDNCQRFTLARIKGEAVAAPERAADTWPVDNDELTDKGWCALTRRVLDDLQQAVDLAGDPQALDRDVKPGVTVRDALEDLVAHNAYHFGRIVLIRQLLGAWPPPSGGFTW